MNKLNKLNLTTKAKELQLVNDRKTANVPIFKAILTTTDGKQAYYFENLKALTDFAKREKNYGLELFKLEPTAIKLNLNLTILALTFKLKENREILAKIWQKITSLRETRKQVASNEFYTASEKIDLKRQLDEQIKETRAEYNRFYYETIQETLAKLEWCKQARASKWADVVAVRLNTAILRKYN